LIGALALMVIVGPAYGGDLCKANSFTRSQAEQGKRDYESSCGLCHQYNLRGRLPGNYRNEAPDIGLLDANYIKTLDGNGGMTPPLLGERFFGKWKDVKAFADRISSAIGAFPPKNYVKPDSDMRIAAYILYRNCGKL
jgi:mono/diheme cytochrome c family protein